MGMILVSNRFVYFYGYIRIYNQVRNGKDLYPNQRLFFDRDGNPSSHPLSIMEKIDMKEYYEE